MPLNTRAGQLRDRVTFQTGTPSQGDGGQPIMTWADTQAMWADVVQDVMTEGEDQEKNRARTVWTITVRYLATLNERMRITHDTHTLQILGVVADKRRRWMTFTCIEEV